MIQKKLKSGGHVNVLGEGESPVIGEINFTDKEFNTAMRLAKSTSDPEAEKEFWKTVLEKKMADETYSLFRDFPEVGSGEQPGPSPTASPSAHAAPKDSIIREKFKGEHICRETIEFLRRPKIHSPKEPA